MVIYRPPSSSTLKLAGPIAGDIHERAFAERSNTRMPSPISNPLEGHDHVRLRVVALGSQDQMKDRSGSLPPLGFCGEFWAFGEFLLEQIVSYFSLVLDQENLVRHSVSSGLVVSELL